MQNTHIKNLSSLLLATFFISTSGVLGRYIAMSPEVSIWSRSLLAAFILFGFCKYKKINLRIQHQKEYTPFFISAIFMGLHWITYFYALQLSNVALGLLSLYTFPIIVSLLEPLFLKTTLNPIHILLGLLVLLGLYILSPDFNIENTEVQGVLCGVFSAFCYAIRILILKQHVANYNGMMLMFYQTLIISILLLPVLFFMDLSDLETQYPYIIILAVVTTAAGHSLMLHALQFFSATTTSIISSLQPVFGIILAFFLLNEIPNANTFLGGSLILFTVVIESLRSRKK